MSDSSGNHRPDPVPHTAEVTSPLVLQGMVSPVPTSLGGNDLFATPIARGSAESQISQMLLRRKWSMLAVFICVSAVSIPPIWIFVKPRYESTAVIQIDPTSMMMAFKTEDNALTSFYESYVNTQVSIIRSPELLNRVLDQESIRKTSWYTDEGRSLIGSALPPLERLQDELKVQPRPRTKLIQVSISTRNSADARLIVNTVVDKYVAYVGELDRKMGADRIDALRKENVDRQRRINDLRETQFTLSRRFGALDLNQLRSQLSTDIHRLETERAEAKRLLDITEWQLEQMRPAGSRPAGSKGGDPTATRPVPASMPVYVVDAEWRRFNLDVRTARHALELAQKKYGDAHPKLADLKDQLEFAERILQEREAQLDVQGIHSAAFTEGAGSAAPSSRVELTRQVQQQQRVLTLLDADLEKQRAMMDDVANVAQQIAMVDDQIRQNQQTNDEVRKRIEVLEVEGKAPARIQVASYGIEPIRPDKDRRILLTAMALAAAAMAALALTYLRATLDSRITGISDVQATPQVPFLGHLRHLPKGIDPLDTDEQLFNENVRMIRTSLLSRLRDIQSPVILITSPLSQCGKTTASVLLAKSIATLGKRVLLVETDFRHSSLADYLQIESELGLANILMGESSDEETIVKAVDIGIHVLPAGDKAPLFALEYLANGQFAACLKRWRTTYDYILLDAPPVLPVADARILTAHADGTVMVLRSSRCRRGDAVESYACLRASGGSLLGTVLIGGEPFVGSGYAYGYEYYSVRSTSES